MGPVLQQAFAAKKARAKRFTHAAQRYEDNKKFREATRQMSVSQVTSIIEVVNAKPDLKTLFSQAWAMLEKDLSPINRVQRLVCTHFDVSRTDLISQRRTADIVLPRQVAMYLAKKLTLKSLPEIGRRFGGRDHSTVLHAVRKIEKLAATDAEFGIRIAALIAQHEEDER